MIISKEIQEKAVNEYLKHKNNEQVKREVFRSRF